MSTYSERFTSMWHSCGPGSWRYLFTTQQDIERARKDPSNNLASRQLLAAVLHPDTLEPIPLPFRMCAHVPVNSFLLLAMLTSSTPLTVACSQAANQLFNACQFYANRNASNPVSDERLAASLVGSLGSAVAVGSGLQWAAGRYGLHSSKWALVIPFLGASAAKPLQIGLMRGDEFTVGVDVFDGAGVCHGKSRVAGERGVVTTIATRVLYLAPMLWMPFAQQALEGRVPLLRTNSYARLASYLLHAGANSALVTPACIALFDQRASIKAGDLEESFQGRGVETYYFNKGL